MPDEKSLAAITSLADLTRIAAHYASHGAVFYRGQSEDWALLPSIARIKPKTTLPADERGMFADFKQQAEMLLGEAHPTNDLDWLAIAQHYGLPTRLLDWSRDAAIALWFAVRKAPASAGRAGVLWVFTPDARDVLDDLERKKPFQGSHTKVFIPQTDVLDKRIISQKGAFTVHKLQEGGTAFTPLEDDARLNNKLFKYTIAPSFFAPLRTDLQVEKGINDFVLFPDLEGLARKLVLDYCRPM